MSALVTVGYDGSTPSGTAVIWAANEAVRRAAGLRIVSCYSMPVMLDPWIGALAIDIESIAEAARQGLATITDKVTERHGDLPVEPITVLGAAGDVLVEQAAKGALLVVGTTGAGGARSLLLGSVAHDVARTAACPVALVPAGDRPTTNRVVVGFDGSAAAEAAVIWAADEADLRDAELVIVHGWEYPYARGFIEPEGRDLTRVDAALVLDQAVAASRDRGRGPVRGELAEGGPAAVLLDATREADLVVVGSRGRGGFRSLLFGSVAHTVAQHSPCPTVIIRDHETE